MSSNLLTLMDSFFDDFRPVVASSVSRAVSTAPALNVREYKDKYEISLTIPGIDSKKIKIELVDRLLNINYNHDDQVKEKTDAGELIRQEYKHYSFTRSVSLPKNVDESSIEAESENGILKIKINKLPESQPKAVEIKIK